MKPIKLYMSAFGPYKYLTVVDFTNFNYGLLLITGPTGSGKTSIFDAICFVLYGEASGSVRDSNSLRSDYATPETKTYVKLEFTHDGNTYNIERTPKYMRKKTRGEGFTEEPSTSYLTGPNIEISNNNEVTKKIEEILGLDYKQFKQVSMLSQGEFSKLLLAKTEDKTAIFRKIFDTSIFSNISYKLKQLYLSKKNEYEKNESILNNELSKLDFDTNMLPTELLNTIDSKIKELTIILDNQTKDISKLEQTKNELSISVKLQENINNLFDSLNKSKKELNELESNNSNIKYDKELFEFNKILYQDIKPFYDIVTNTKTKLLNNKEYLNDINNTKKELDTKYIKIMDEYKKIDDLDNELDKINSNINIISLGIKSLSEIKKDKELLINKTNKLNEISDFYNDLFNKYSKDELLYYNSQAGLLASKLNENEECPVCGSLSHPHLATLIDNVLSEDELKVEQNEVNKLLENKNKIVTELESIKTKITVEANNINKITTFDLNKLDLINSELEDKLNKINNNKKELANKINEITTNKNDIDKLLSTTSSRYELVTKTIKELTIEKDTNNNILMTNLKNNNITLDDYSKLLDIDEYKKLDKKISNYDEQYTSLSSKINLLLNQTKDKSKKDINEDITKLDDLETSYKELKQLKDTTMIKLTSLNNSNNSIKNIYKEIDKVSKEYKTLQILSDTANGNLSGKQRITFENYVQSSYLNTVLLEANKRLLKMSDSRFELRRKDTSNNLKEKLGLEFVVFDSYTGKEREVSTLSGGESFKASLSLALGLSDVIQMYAGGIKVEALFIDEGFGTLDSESIEQALNTLYSLSENNRLIGIISHVEELISRIDNKIIIKKTSTGSSIELVTN